MRCPFGFKRRKHFSFGVDPGFMDFVAESEAREEAEFNAKYPTCWAKFLHWMRGR